MIIQITRRHIRIGQPKKNECPLSIACQEAFDLPASCVDVCPKTLVLSNYTKCLVYSLKWPVEAETFYERYFGHYSLGTKRPGPCKFILGGIDYYPHIIEDIVKKIHNWDGKGNEDET